MGAVGDDLKERAGAGRVEEVPLAAPEHEHEVLSVVEVALGDDSPRSETALDTLLMINLDHHQYTNNDNDDDVLLYAFVCFVCFFLTRHLRQTLFILLYTLLV